MAEMAKTDEGIVRLARMNERVDRYVAKRLEEGDQHASQGGIAGNASHIVPLPEFVPFDPIETALRAGSSADIDAPSPAPPAEQRIPPDNGIVIEAPAGGMDLDLVAKANQRTQSRRVSEKGQKFDRMLSEARQRV